MNSVTWHMEEISRIEGDRILFGSITFESSRSGNKVAIDIVISMVMPARSHPWFTSCANDKIIFTFEDEMPRNARAG
jgi:hypothetical protein